MILISSNNSDSSTNEVIDWLLYFGKNFIRVNEDTKLKFGSYDLFKRTFSVCIQDDNQVYNLAFNDIKSYWYRRGTLSFSYEKISSNVEQNILSENLNLFLRYEIDSLVVFLNTKLKNIPTVIGHENSTY